MKEVIDGDTIEVELGGETLRVRYYGSDAPERGEACYEEARAVNHSLVDSRVLLEPDARDRDRYGRLLRYVFTAQGGSIDAALVQAGLAHAWRRDGKHRYWLMGLEEQAQAEGRGCLWQ